MAPNKGPADAAGFTLIEALIALTILAIAASALIGAAGADIRRIARLQDRALAQLVAENYLAELRIAGSRSLAGTDHVVMGARSWDVETATAATSDPDLVDVNISVRLSGAGEALMSLRGFIDVGAGRS